MSGALPKQESAESSTLPSAPQHSPKVAALDSFLKLWKRKPGSPPVSFPPPTWFDASKGSSNTASTPTTDGDIGLKAAASVPLPETPGVESAPPSVTSPAPEGARPQTGEEADEPAPGTLAQRIRDLLASYSPTAPPPPSGPHPVPPPPPAAVDAALAKLLESAAVMNGSISRGKKSVWDALDKMRAPKHAAPEAPHEGKGKGAEEDGRRHGDASENGDDEDDDDDSSLMVYAPLIPSADSELELARSETVKVDEHGNILSIIEEGPSRVADLPTTDEEKESDGDAKRKKRSSWWPFPKKGKGEGESKEGGDVDKGKTKDKKIWIPSLTAISFQASWWGYRLYLPPPVMAVLDNKSIETAKRAAMLTAALQWIVNKIPTTVFPPPLRPAVMLAKKLLPYVGYIGAALAWGWSTIKSFDKGHGVILTATWLLPVALIPGTWEENNVPKIPSTPSDMPKTPGAPSDASKTPGTSSTGGPPISGSAAVVHAPETAL